MMMIMIYQSARRIATAKIGIETLADNELKYWEKNGVKSSDSTGENANTL